MCILYMLRPQTWYGETSLRLTTNCTNFIKKTNLNLNLQQGVR